MGNQPGTRAESRSGSRIARPRIDLRPSDSWQPLEKGGNDPGVKLAAQVCTQFLDGIRIPHASPVSPQGRHLLLLPSLACRGLP